jgi:hypothetical protein
MNTTRTSAHRYQRAPDAIVLFVMNTEPVIPAMMTLGEQTCENTKPADTRRTAAPLGPVLSIPKPFILQPHHTKEASVATSSNNTESSDSSTFSTTDDLNDAGPVLVDRLILYPSPTIDNDDKKELQRGSCGHGTMEDSNEDSTGKAQTNKPKTGASDTSSSYSSQDQDTKLSPKSDITKTEFKMKPKRRVASEDNHVVTDSDLSARSASSGTDGPAKKKARGSGSSFHNAPTGAALPPALPLVTLFPTTVTHNAAAPTPSAAASHSMLLLTQPTDDVILSPLHSFVRKQIEVFTATADDLQLPCPGRKNPIQLHQVGLRCIHCRHVPIRDRVKRAICYPSSLGRVYHSASDMKCDHFSSCKALPAELRAEFQRLKGLKKPSAVKPVGYSSSTAQYYHDCACQMGMVDGSGGVFFSKTSPAPSPGQNGNTFAAKASSLHAKSLEPPQDASGPLSSVPSSRATTSTASNHLSGTKAESFLNGPFLLPGGSLSPTMAMALLAPNMQREILQHACFQRQLVLAMMMTSNAVTAAAEATIFPAELPPPNQQSTPRDASRPGHTTAPAPLTVSVPTISTGLVLGSPLDQEYLNPIHCFVRRHVEFFAATEQDITAPSPGRRTKVLPGQVGLRCVHCARLPVKDRVKRAVCYPPSVNGIYHCVSNMKFDHFANCRGLPAPDRQEFLGLRDVAQASARRTSSTKNGNNSVKGSSTFCYYHDSALRMGLVDTEQGIRLIQDVERNIQMKINLNQQEKESKAAKEKMNLADDTHQLKSSKDKVRVTALQVLVQKKNTATACAGSKEPNLQERSTSKSQHDGGDVVDSSSQCVSDGISALMLAANHPRAAV